MNEKYEIIFNLLDRVEELEFVEKQKRVRLGKKEYVVSLKKELEQTEKKSFTTTRIEIRQVDGYIKMASCKIKKQKKDGNHQSSSYCVREFFHEYAVQTEKKKENIGGPYFMFTITSSKFRSGVYIYQPKNGEKKVSVDDKMFYKKGNLMMGHIGGKTYAYDFVGDTYTIDGIDCNIVKDGYAKMKKRLKSVNHIYKDVLKKDGGMIPSSTFDKIKKEERKIDYGIEKTNVAKKYIDESVDKWTDFSESEVEQFKNAVIDMIADIKVENMAQNITQQLSSLNTGQKKQVLSKIMIKK